MTKKRLIIATFVLVVCIALVCWYVNGGTSVDTGESKPQSAAPDSMMLEPFKNGDAQRQGAVEPSAKSKADVDKFQRSLEKYADVRLALKTKREQLEKNNPLVSSASNYGSSVMVAVQNQYRAMLPEYYEYLQTHKEATARLTEVSQRVQHPLGVLELLNSTDKVGDSTVGAIIDDLLRHTDYFDIIREELSDATLHELNDPVMAASLKNAADLETLSKEINGVSSKLKTIYKDVVRTVLPSDEYRRYAFEMGQATATGYAMKAYEKSWSQELEKVMNANTAAYGELRDLMDKYPIDSPVRSEMANQLSAYHAGTTPETSNATPKIP